MFMRFSLSPSGGLRLPLRTRRCLGILSSIYFRAESECPSSVPSSGRRRLQPWLVLGVRAGYSVHTDSTGLAAGIARGGLCGVIGGFPEGRELHGARPAARFSSPYLHVVVMYLPPRGGLGCAGHPSFRGILRVACFLHTLSHYGARKQHTFLALFGKSTEVETRLRSFSFPDPGLPRAAGWVDCFGVRVSYFWRFWHLSLP
ncbi:hypothetical protein DFH08DRAFT_315380 [Mycena albidolilacea]|uniref:Uncharacterized protein n=1 Tax=Mycena albidolilacea TaxID=1033008 RepID=A0AAD7EK78_9AGAR|nr:hypothetical protein DFH08DRAFT_315380 [Mycena albidolilacea]